MANAKASKVCITLAMDGSISYFGSFIFESKQWQKAICHYWFILFVSRHFHDRHGYVEKTKAWTQFLVMYCLPS